MTSQDQTLTALTAWRENRSASTPGLQSVANVVMNRVAKSGDSPYAVCTQHAQFSSISEPGPEADLWPEDADPQWREALIIAWEAVAGRLPDLTQGSTLYYAPTGITSTKTFTLPDGSVVPFPEAWNPAVVTYQASIGGQLFFTEQA